MQLLLEDLVKSNGIPCQVVESRAKLPSSFAEKISRPGKKYNDPINDIPDLCGCRIIVYYLEDVGKVCELIKSQFLIIEEELSHQPAALKANQFGYLSAHYVLSLDKNRSELPEWLSYKTFRSEIQVRTVIQHAWSAVSHALQYKAETEIPSKLQRRLFRIAGLFELADEEFGAIRAQKLELRERASAALAAGNTDIPLSHASLLEFLNSWQLLPQLIASAEKAGFEVHDEEEEDDADDENNTLANLYDLANRHGVNTISNLKDMLQSQNFSVLQVIYNGQSEKTKWRASNKFIIYLMLVIAMIDEISIDYLVSRGWSQSIAQDVVNAASSKN